MKILTLTLIPLCLPMWAADLSCKVERGLNILRNWKEGALASETKQVLTDCTNLFQQERYWQDIGDWTQKVSLAWYSGNGTMPLKEGWTLAWDCLGNVASNRMDPEGGAWSVFNSGGNQGAMTVVNGDERTQIINLALLRAEWKTNGTVYSCPGEDDTGTMILWYRTNAPVGLPWFVGGYCSLEPGERKLLKIPTPVDMVWRFMGTDKCVSCRESCWLAGWPEPAAKTQTSITASHGSFGSSLQLAFSGTPGVTYALKGSFNLRDWFVHQVADSDDQGGVDYIVPAPAGTSFFRVEAVSTATMNEQETALAVEEIRQFNQP